MSGSLDVEPAERATEIRHGLSPAYAGSKILLGIDPGVRFAHPRLYAAACFADWLNVAATRHRLSAKMAKGEPHIPTCFVIMPISDVDGYDAGHFGRVYEFIIKPACKNAGFKPVRADEVQVTNYIVVDILRKILDADMIVCDLSARNSNVLYELGIRQAFNRPVTLIRDSRTPRIFDIQGLRDLEYDESLRIDKINSAVESLTNLLKNTSKLEEGDLNSIIQLLGVRPAQAPSVEISKDTSLVLNAISDISTRLSRLEDATLTEGADVDLPMRQPAPYLPPTIITGRGIILIPGRRVWHPSYGEGVVRSVRNGSVLLDFKDGEIIQFDRESPGIEELDSVSGRVK